MIEDNKESVDLSSPFGGQGPLFTATMPIVAGVMVSVK